MLSTAVAALSDWMYTYILVILLFAAGVYFSLRTRFVQFRLFKEAFRVVGEKAPEKGAVSSLEALMVSTASRVGTGNIAGVSTALCLGGVGSVFWMWAIAILGGLTSATPAAVIGWSLLYGVFDICGYKKGDGYPIMMIIGTVFAA